MFEIFQILIALTIVIVMITEIMRPGTIIKSRKKKYEGPKPAPKLIDEATIAESFFGKDYVEAVDCEKFLKKNAVEPEVYKTLCVMCNTYSRAGFQRYLKYGAEKDTNKHQAAILICFMLDLKYESLWKDDFMTWKEFQDYCNMLGV